MIPVIPTEAHARMVRRWMESEFVRRMIVPIERYVSPTTFLALMQNDRRALWTPEGRLQVYRRRRDPAYPRRVLVERHRYPWWRRAWIRLRARALTWAVLRTEAHGDCDRLT